MTSLPDLQANITAQGEGQAFAPVIAGNVFNGPVILQSDSNRYGNQCGSSIRCSSSSLAVNLDGGASSTTGPASRTGQRERDYTDLSNNLKRSLKVEYERILDGNSLTGYRRYLNEVYTELYIVQNETGGVIQGHEVSQMEAFSRRPVEEDVPIKCNNIFKVQADGIKRNRKVLTMGIAGVGKTVSVNKFILDWAEGKDNDDLTFVFPLPFRELNILRNEELTLMELLETCLPGPVKLDSLPQGDGKVLFIFDGLDECRIHLNFKDHAKLKDVNTKASVGVIITNLIRRNLLASALVWITSRPAAAHLIRREHIDQVTEVRGFNDQQKEEYISRYCGEDVGGSILAHIKKSRSLYIMCHIPVFCWISATALQSLPQDQNPKTPTTLTGMYVRFLVQQTNQMKEKYDGCPQNIILRLAELAFCQLIKGNPIFYKEDLEASGIDINEGSVYSGLCTQIFKVEKRLSKRMVFSFVHLSVQEALAAIHVFYCYRSSKKNVFIQNLKTKLKWWLKRSSFKLHRTGIQRALQSENGHLDLFLRFLLGLSVESNQSSLEELLPGLKTKPKGAEKTINYIKEKIRGSETSERTFNLFHCLSELEDDSLVSEVQNYLKPGELLTKDLSSMQWSAVVFVLLMSDETQEMFELKKYRESDDGLRRLLPVVRNTKRAVLNFCQISKASCGPLASILSSNSSYLIELDLSNNDLQDSGVEQLSGGLKNSQCKLRTLKLSGCMVTEKGCSSLALALSSNPSHLRELDLSYNHPGPSGKRELYERLDEPNFKLDILNIGHGGEERIKPGLRKYACELTLDPDTAHPNLSLSDRNRTVKWWKENPPSPDHPDRFDTWSQVLSRESLAERCYWEVQWSDMGVHIGVTYRGILRKGGGNECWFGQNGQSWSLDCTKVKYTARHNGIKTEVPAAGRCSYRIGVFLDRTAGRLSFYDVSSNTESPKLAHLHTFSAMFTEPLYTGLLVIESIVTLSKPD